MSKSNLVDAIAEKSNLTKAQSSAVLSDVFEVIASFLEQDETVRIPNFGTFQAATRAARSGKNPRTGEKIDIPESKQVKFKAGKALKERIVQ